MPRLLDPQQMADRLDQLAAAIVADVPPDVPLSVIGIRRRGETLAQRLLPLLDKRGRPAEHFGALDITLYRDDLTTIGPNAVVRGTAIEFDITDTWLVLVDDVLYTGRSVRAALDALTDLGRPRTVRLAVMVDRGWRELPIQPDFTALQVETTQNQIVYVKLIEVDGIDEVEVHERSGN